MSEMLATTGSFEVLEWAAEYKIRNDDERAAMEDARTRDDETDGGPSVDDQEIIAAARERGHIS